jgi:hypothetical protein
MMPIILLLCVGAGYLWDGIQKKSKKSFIVSSIGFTLMFAMFPLAGLTFEQEDKKHDAMVGNILTKYDHVDDMWNFPYLKDVKYEGRGSKHERGTYFTLTYGDGTTAKVKFFFSDKTGEPKPRCSCDLKKIEDFSTKDQYLPKSR